MVARMGTTGDARLAALRSSIDGDVLAPGDEGYDDGRRTPVTRFVGSHPRAIVRCASTADVAATVAFARASGLPLAVRSGGHSFAGRSSSDGVVLDVRPLRAIAPTPETVTVGAGARLGEIYDALDPHGLTIAGGCGPTVGISGLVLGGGLGILGRRHGLTCDQPLAAEVVLADGRAVRCDEAERPDLFWGCAARAAAASAS